jgi:hypothetical protein
VPSIRDHPAPPGGRIVQPEAARHAGEGPGGSDCRRQGYGGDRGGSKIDSTIILRTLKNLGLEEAKRIVHFSAAWGDVKARDESLWDDMEGDFSSDT